LGRLQELSGLVEVMRLGIIASLGTERRDRNSRVGGRLGPVENPCIRLRTFDVKTVIIDIGFGGIRLVFSKNNGII
jgi:hypothetical protein